MTKKQVWVSPNSQNGGWRIHKPGDSRDIIHMDNKQAAVERAKEIAKKQKTELITQKRDGKIGERNSYGRDPFPPRG